MNIYRPTYTAILLGAANSLPDYAFLISYYSNNKRDGVDSYHNCVTPYAIETLDAFTDRPDGDVEIHKDGAMVETFNVVNVAFHVGARNQSISISGSKQVTNTSPITYPVALSEVSAQSRDSYGRTVLTTVPFDTWAIRPADSVTYNGITYTVVTTAFSVGNTVYSSILTLEELP